MGEGGGGIVRLVGFQYIMVQRRTMYVQRERERGRMVHFGRISGYGGGQQYLQIMRTVKLGAVRVAAPARK